jgi:hypothetical protein
MAPSQDNLLHESKIERKLVSPIAKITTPGYVAIIHRARDTCRH